MEQQSLFSDLNFDEKTEGMYDVILVDGSHLLHRSAHAYSLGVLKGENYIPTGAVYGFLKIVQTMRGRYADTPCKIIFCWEGGYRHRLALYPNYKANRRVRSEVGDTDQQIVRDTFRSDFAKQKELLEYFLSISGWNNCRVEGYEADDVLASLAKKYDDGKTRVAIYSGDGDLHQCVSENVHIISAGSGKRRDVIYKFDDVVKKWGVDPTRIPLIKALSGDKSDDIPGCKGCGLGWATKILNTYDNLNEIFEHIEGGGILVGEYKGKNWKAKTISGNLHQCKDDVYVSEQLAYVVDTLECDVRKSSLNMKAISDFFREYEFNSFLVEDFLVMGK